MPLAQDDTQGGVHTHNASDIDAGTLIVGRGGTGLTAVGAADTVFKTNTGATANEYAILGDASNSGLTTAALSGSAAITKAQISDTGTWGIAEIPDSGKKIALVVAVTDETTVLTTGTSKVKFRIPFGFSCDEARAMLSTAGTGAALVTVDINDDTVSLFSTVLTIDSTEKTSETAAAASVLTSTPLTIADDSEMTVDIDTIDTDNVATGLKIALIGQRS